MKPLVLVAVSILFFSFSVSASPSASQANKWQLYKLLDDAREELNENEHNLSQVNKAYKHIKKAIRALRKPTKITPALIVISETDPYDYQDVIAGEFSLHTFVITNVGEGDATIIGGEMIGGSFSFAGGVYPGDGGDCQSIVASSTSCNVVIEFSPADIGLKTSSLAFNYNDGLSDVTVTRLLQGTGVISPADAALLVVEGGPIFDFGEVIINQGFVQSFKVTNTGGAVAAGLASSFGVGAFQYLQGVYPGLGGDCGLFLEPQQTCDLMVEFNPTSFGIFEDNIRITYFDGVSDSFAELNMTGTGIQNNLVANLTISEAEPFEFGNVNVSERVNHTFVITNTGLGDATDLAGLALDKPYSYRGGTFPGRDGDCSANLAPTQSCSVVVKFAPKEIGLFQASFGLTYNDSVANQTVIRGIQGSGVAGFIANLFQ